MRVFEDLDAIRTNVVTSPESRGEKQNTRAVDRRNFTKLNYELER